jgi:hypothetical protein
MSNLPVVRLADGITPSRQLVRAANARQRTELAIYEHALAARYLAECDCIDSQAVADATKAALDEEIRNLDWGMERSAGSPAKAELVARMVAMQSRIDTARISRHFGG